MAALDSGCAYVFIDLTYRLKGAMTESKRRRSDTSVIAIAAVTAGGMVAATRHGLVATVVTTALCAGLWLAQFWIRGDK